MIELGLIQLKIDRLADLSKRNNKEMEQANSMFMAGTISLSEYRETVERILKSNLAMKVDLKGIHRTVKGMLKKNATDSIKSTNKLIKALKEILWMIDNDQVYEKAGE